jgi:hypothetical protein
MRMPKPSPIHRRERLLILPSAAARSDYRRLLPPVATVINPPVIPVRTMADVESAGVCRRSPVATDPNATVPVRLNPVISGPRTWRNVCHCGRWTTNADANRDPRALRV